MNEKNCTDCKELKPLSEFTKNKQGKDGLAFACKSCLKARRTAYRKTKDGLIGVIYHNQCSHSGRRGHPLPSYSLKQLKEWVYGQPNFEELYNDWLESGYDRKKSPSIDRMDDYKPYAINNLLRICTWDENNKRGKSDMINGLNNKNSKAVHKFASNGEFIAEYYSASQASRETGVSQRCISKCCLGSRKTAGGFMWQFANLMAV